MATTKRTRVTIEEAAQLLGVAPSTVRGYAARGHMPAPSSCPCCGTGSTWPRAELDAWLASRPGRPGRPRKSES